MNEVRDKSYRVIPKNEVLRIIDLLLAVCDEYPRPTHSELLQREMSKYAHPYPNHVKDLLNEYDDELEGYKVRMEEVCKERHPEDFKTLSDRYPGIVNMVLKRGSETVPQIAQMLSMAEGIHNGTSNAMETEYRAGEMLRNQFVLRDLGMTPQQVNEMDIRNVDIDKLKKQYPTYFQ